MNYTVVKNFTLPSAAIDRAGKADRIIIVKDDTQAESTIIMPAESYTEARFQSRLKELGAQQATTAGKTYTV